MIYEEVPTYEEILNQWELDITSTRLQIESFITILQNSKADLLNVEIDDEDKSLKTYKFYHKLSNKIFDKTHTVKPKDLAAGMFNDTTEADPIVAFEKYNNPQANQAESYHPRKILGINDVVVEKTVGFQPELPLDQHLLHLSLCNRPHKHHLECITHKVRPIQWNRCR